MGYGIIVRFDEIRELAFGGVSSSYAAVGTPMTDNMRIIAFNSSFDEEIYVSFDGTTDNLRMVPNSFKLYDLAGNLVRNDGFFLAKGTQIYIKEVSSTPTSGAFWIEAVYADGGV
jgi:hypothetical protein